MAGEIPSVQLDLLYEASAKSHGSCFEKFFAKFSMQFLAGPVLKRELTGSLYTILNTTNLTLLLYDASVSIGTVTTVPVAYLMRAVAYWRVAVRVF